MSHYYQSTQSLWIPAPPQKVYNALTDWAVRSRWREGIGIEWEGESGAFVGQKITFKVRAFPPYSFSFRVAGLEPPHRMYMAYEGTLRGRGALEIKPQEGGSLTALHWMKVEPAGFWPGIAFALGWGVRSHRLETQKTLRLLKTYFEPKPNPTPRRQDAK